MKTLVRHSSAILGLLAPLALAACSGGGEPSAAPEASEETLPDPAEAGLVTPEEAAQDAEEAIDASNAESELEKLQREIEEG